MMTLFVIWLVVVIIIGYMYGGYVWDDWVMLLGLILWPVVLVALLIVFAYQVWQERR